MGIEYSAVLQRVRMQLSTIMGDGYSLSPAAIETVRGMKCEAYYAYRLSGRGSFPRPYLRLVTDFESGTLLEFRNARYAEFADADCFPLESEMSPAVPAAKTATEQMELVNKLQILYEKVRAFALSETITAEEKELLREYRTCLSQTVPEELLAFCVHNEANYFDWVDKASQ